MWDAVLFDFDLFVLFYHFILYSFFGWIYESCLISFQHKKWINRGFLNGPWIPIYGAGATIITVVLYPIRSHYIAVFFAGMLLATVLEFVTSFLMEKLFHAKWWDYSEWKFNIQGRVCLYVSLFWGLLSVTMFALLEPGMSMLIASIPRAAGEYAGYVLLVLFAVDLIATVVSTLQFDKKLADLQKVRNEFIEYMESTKLYEIAGEWKEKLSGIRMPEWGEKFRSVMESVQISRDLMNELEEKIKSFTMKYQGKLEKTNPIHKRLLKAFPNLKPTGRENVLKDWKEKIFGRKK